MKDAAQPDTGPDTIGTLGDFFKVALWCNVAFAVPGLAVLLAAGRAPLLFIVLLLGPFHIIGIPVAVVMGWLIAKGSNGANANVFGFAKAIGALPGSYYGLLLGGLLGGWWLGPIGAGVMAVGLFVLGRLLGVRLGAWAGRRVWPDRAG